MLATAWLPQCLEYTGAQARSGWIAEMTGCSGDGIAAFTGPCDVQPEHMLDLEDLRAGETIRAALMLHFLIEHYDISLALGVARQRLFACLAREILSERYGLYHVKRSGDDLFVNERKLSISIAAPAPASVIIHFALNIDPSGAPVPAVGLRELHVAPEEFAGVLMEAYRDEIAGSLHAESKVRPTS